MGLWMVVGGWVALLECLCECVLEGVGGEAGSPAVVGWRTTLANI